MENRYSQLCSSLDLNHCSKNARPLHLFALFPQISVEEVPEVAKAAGVDATTRKDGENVYTLQIVSAHKRRFAYGNLVDFKNSWLMMIKTIESPTVAGDIAKLWIKRMYPSVSRSFIDPKHLLSILDDLAKIEGAKLELRGYILRAHNSPETMKQWPRDKPYSREKIEREINQQNKYLEAINFIYKVDGTFFHVRIETNGHFVFYNGGRNCFSMFERLVLSRYVEIAIHNHRFFSNKERKVLDGDAYIDQLIISQEKKFTKDDLVSLSFHLTSGYSSAVLHSGNPWLWMNVLDRGDGSSFDIYGYPSEIKIVPFNKASAESLMRLFYLIRELFPLTEIKGREV